MLKDKVYEWRDQLETNKRVLVEWTPRGSRVLEFGCATGYMSRVLRDDRGCRVTGFECSAAAAQQAAPFCERLIVGDIEDEARWAQLTGPYDVVMFADVLEHLRDAETVLRRARELLVADGFLLISMPNVAHHTVRWQLLRGRFDYTESGLLDDTHLRFYTRSSTLALLRRCGFRVEELTFSLQATRLDRILRRLRLGALQRALERVACSVTPDAMAFQWLVLARPLHAGEESVAPPRLRGPADTRMDRRGTAARRSAIAERLR